MLAVAREQFVTHGFPGTTMDAIAARAKVSKQTLYAAYPSKDDLYAAVVRDWVDRGHDALRPVTLALREAADVGDGLRRLAAALQAGILSVPVRQMRTLVSATADAFPGVAADYVTRSWDRNLRLLADTLADLAGQGRLTVTRPDVAAEQFVWLVIGAPLNELTLRGTPHEYPAAELARIADEGVVTFLSRYRSS